MPENPQPDPGHLLPDDEWERVVADAEKHREQHGSEDPS